MAEDVATEYDTFARAVGVSPSSEMTTGASLIAAERRRQIDREGWTAEHDDAEHPNAELASAAVCYAFYAAWQGNGASGWTARMVDDMVLGDSIITWPWDETWWKPSADPVRNLVKAGALIAAEIDRLRRTIVRSEDPSAREREEAAAHGMQGAGGETPQQRANSLDLLRAVGARLKMTHPEAYDHALAQVMAEVMGLAPASLPETARLAARMADVEGDSALPADAALRASTLGAP